MKDRSNFLLFIKNYVKEDPEAAAYIQNYVAAGLKESLDKALSRAADFEVLFSCLYSKKSKHFNPEELILSKLKKLQSQRTAMNWESTIKEIEDRLKKEV